MYITNINLLICNINFYCGFSHYKEVKYIYKTICVSNIYILIYIYIKVYIMYIYIHIEREKEKERCICVFLSLWVQILICAPRVGHLTSLCLVSFMCKIEIIMAYTS